MEKKYYVSNRAQTSGDHEVHDENCYFLPEANNRIFLGHFPSCEGAVVEAKKYYSKADGCLYWEFRQMWPPHSAIKLTPNSAPN